MPDVTAELFDSLGKRGHEPLLEQAAGTLRFELENGRPERWVVDIDHGDVHVSHTGGKPDCTVHAEKELFDGIVKGEVNAFAALLRGAVTLDGDPELFMLFQRLFPGPPRGGKKTGRSANA